MKTAEQVREEIARLDGLQKQWEGQLQTAQGDLKLIEETTGDLVLEAVLAGEDTQTEQVAQRLASAQAGVLVAEKTLASMKKQRVRLEIERIEAMIAEAAEELQRRQDEHKAHCKKRDQLLRALVDFEGGAEYIVKPRPTFEQVLSYGPIQYNLPLSERLQSAIDEQAGTIQAYRTELEHQRARLAKM